jgi:hypothetical protein
MKLRNWIRRVLGRPAPHDPIHSREQLGEAIAQWLISQGFSVTGMQYNCDGPLGGQSTRIICVGGGEAFTINVYVRGVYAPDNERVRNLIGGHS